MRKELIAAAVIGILAIGGTAWEATAQESSESAVSGSNASDNDGAAPAPSTPKKSRQSSPPPMPPSGGQPSGNEAVASISATADLPKDNGSAASSESTATTNVPLPYAQMPGIGGNSPAFNLDELDPKTVALAAIVALVVSVISLLLNIVLIILHSRPKAIPESEDDEPGPGTPPDDKKLESDSKLEAKITKLEDNIHLLGGRIETLEKTNIQQPQPAPAPIAQPAEPDPQLPEQPPPRVYTYLSSICDNYFRSASDQPQGSLYGMFDECNGVANFEFCGDASDAGTALEDLSAYIYPICEVEGNIKDATTIKNVSPGQVTLQSGRWVVKTRAKIAIS